MLYTRTMQHPFLWLNPKSLPRLLVVLTLVLLALSAWMLALDQTLVNEQAPQGIVSFELAGNADKAARILAVWAAPQREQAMFMQGMDNLYLLVYPTWLALTLTLLASGLGPRSQRLAQGLAWLVLFAIPLDLTENYALLVQLRHGASNHWAALALLCAVPKFGLVALAAASCLVLGIARLIQRLGKA
ncbi:hypothetical protein EYC98_05245 [Halieaceae bacterium IMCC14734]|uniref:DUF2079 domain-containing protein n=1 Tax=Candidatus Litorirhabdus singularis TaxID=2518993 RepID=A0ABT3TD93_9GAMM|nr:hypothetical protein [Candidatus Litorirhabdus singularis]MCX2980273.1 hypothetical protein [Candidatus Litorirhabdus singularis]